MCNDSHECFEIAAEPANRAVTQKTENSFKTHVNNRHRSGASSLSPLNEIVMSHSCGFGFKPFSPFFETFNEKIGQLFANGFVGTLHENLTPDKRKNFDDIGPQVLTMDHLGVAFVACLLPLGLSILVFFIEITHNRFKSAYPKISRCLRSPKTTNTFNDLKMAFSRYYQRTLQLKTQTSRPKN